MVMSERMKNKLVEQGCTYVPTSKLAHVKGILIQRQGDLCPLCEQPLSRLPPARQVADHNHTSKLIRGVLCDSCNLDIGPGDRRNRPAHWWHNVALYLDKEDTEFIYPEPRPKAERDKKKAVAAKRKQEALAKKSTRNPR